MLGRGLVNAQPQPDGCQLDECEVVGREFVIARRDPPTLLYLVEEPLDQLTGAKVVRQRSIAADVNILILPPLSGHRGHGQTRSWLAPVASDPGCVKTLRGIIAPGILGFLS